MKKFTIFGKVISISSIKEDITMTNKLKELSKISNRGYKKRFKNKKYDYRNKEIIVENRTEARKVLSFLNDLIADYGQASVADLYESVGLIVSFDDNKYGWTDLRSASMSKSEWGYSINLPTPKLFF